MKHFLAAIILSLSLSGLITSCASKEGSFFAASLGLGEDLILVVGAGVAATTNWAITVYDTNGNLLDILADYGKTAEQPHGIAVFDSFNFIVAVDGTDRLEKVNIFGGNTLWTNHPQLTGNLFDIKKDASGNFYVVESNTIERFDSSGNRANGTSATPYIAATTGACVLNTPHGIDINADGQLVAVSSGNSTLSVYNVSTSAASCVAQVAFGNAPYDVVSHSDGNLYVITQTNDAVYQANAQGGGATLIWNTAVTTYNPSAIAALPNGNLLVASQGNDGIDLISTSGSLLETNFIKNSMTLDVSDIIVVRGQ